MAKRIDDMSDDERNALFDSLKEVNVIVHLSPVFAAEARKDINGPTLKPLMDAVTRYDAGVRERNQVWVDYYEGLLATPPQVGSEDDRKWYAEEIEGFKREQMIRNAFEVVKDGTAHFMKGQMVGQGISALVADLKCLEGNGVVEKVEIDENPPQKPQWEIWAQNYRAHW